VQIQLEGKSVLVTGSSKGIGRAIAEAFLAEGAHVAFNSRNADELNRVIAAQIGGRAIAVIGDVSKTDQSQGVIEQVLAAFGKLDILVCNVGSGRSVPRVRKLMRNGCGFSNLTFGARPTWSRLVGTNWRKPGAPSFAFRQFVVKS